MQLRTRRLCIDCDHVHETEQFHGNYELTIEIEYKCAQIPPTLRVRRYNATLEDRSTLHLR